MIYIYTYICLCRTSVQHLETSESKQFVFFANCHGETVRQTVCKHMCPKLFHSMEDIITLLDNIAMGEAQKGSCSPFSRGEASYSLPRWIWKKLQQGKTLRKSVENRLNDGNSSSSWGYQTPKPRPASWKKCCKVCILIWTAKTIHFQNRLQKH